MVLLSLITPSELITLGVIFVFVVAVITGAVLVVKRFGSSKKRG